ncbi:hypothetical protein CR513_25050, partial [Mucuna pruriens]
MTINPKTNIDPAQLNLNASSWIGSPCTLRVSSQTNQYKVQMGGYINNFIQEAMARYLGLDYQSTSTLNVLVGNGHELGSEKICKDVSLLIQGKMFVMNHYVVDIQGANVVLGVEWLKGLGLIVTDYTSLTMKFLKGETNLGPATISIKVTTNFKKVRNNTKMEHSKNKSYPHQILQYFLFNTISLSLHSIPIFIRENYDFWSIKTKTFFFSQDFWDIVEERFISPIDISTLAVAQKELKENK